MVDLCENIPGGEADGVDVVGLDHKYVCDLGARVINAT